MQVKLTDSEDLSSRSVLGYRSPKSKVSFTYTLPFNESLFSCAELFSPTTYLRAAPTFEPLSPCQTPGSLLDADLLPILLSCIEATSDVTRKRARSEAGPQSDADVSADDCARALTCGACAPELEREGNPAGAESTGAVGAVDDVSSAQLLRKGTADELAATLREGTCADVSGSPGRRAGHELDELTSSPAAMTCDATEAPPITIPFPGFCPNRNLHPPRGSPEAYSHSLGTLSEARSESTAAFSGGRSHLTTKRPFDDRADGAPEAATVFRLENPVGVKRLRGKATGVGKRVRAESQTDSGKRPRLAAAGDVNKLRGEGVKRLRTAGRQRRGDTESGPERLPSVRFDILGGTSRPGRLPPSPETVPTSKVNPTRLSAPFANALQRTPAGNCETEPSSTESVSRSVVDLFCRGSPEHFRAPGLGPGLPNLPLAARLGGPRKQAVRRCPAPHAPYESGPPDLNPALTRVSKAAVDPFPPIDASEPLSWFSTTGQTQKGGIVRRQKRPQNQPPSQPQTQTHDPPTSPFDERAPATNRPQNSTLAPSRDQQGSSNLDSSDQPKSFASDFCNNRETALSAPPIMTQAAVGVFETDKAAGFGSTVAGNARALDCRRGPNSACHVAPRDSLGEALPIARLLSESEDPTDKIVAHALGRLKPGAQLTEEERLLREKLVNRDPKMATEKMSKMTLEELTGYFELSLAAACKKLGVGRTVGLRLTLGFAWNRYFDSSFLLKSAGNACLHVALSHCPGKRSALDWTRRALCEAIEKLTETALARNYSSFSFFYLYHRTAWSSFLFASYVYSLHD